MNREGVSNENGKALSDKDTLFLSILVRAYIDSLFGGINNGIRTMVKRS
ncbi:hypothetical protein [Clostridium drakei]|nr:hypothetical protein [Clostridium drakei]